MRSVAALALGKVGKSEIEKNCIIFFRETLSFEQTLMSMVRRGDTAALSE